MNQRGTTDSFALSPWLFMVLGMIGLLIVSGVTIFYSKTIDVRKEEAKTISFKLIEGISDDGHIKEKFFDKDFDIFNETTLNKDLFFNGGEYFFNIELLEGDKQVKYLEQGSKDFKVQCEIPGENLADCFKKEIILLGPENKQYTVKIMAGSNQEGAKV